MSFVVRLSAEVVGVFLYRSFFLFMVLLDKKLFCFNNFSIKMHVSVSVLNFCYSCGCSVWNVANGINEYSMFVGQKDKVRWGCWGLIICSMMQRLWWRWWWCCLAWCRIQRCRMKFPTHTCTNGRNVNHINYMCTF